LERRDVFLARVHILDALKEFLPKTHALIEELARHIGKRSYAAKLKRIYPQLENISVDYAILERATQHSGAPRVFVIPAEMGWSDIGSWAAFTNCSPNTPLKISLPAPATRSTPKAISSGAPANTSLQSASAAWWVVETPDALLSCPRDRAQDVGKIVKALEDRKHKKLL